jgi:opacity protein-like surface antigen
MKKLLLLTAVAGLFAFSSVNAQVIKSPKLSVGADFGFPIGDASEGVDFAFGGSLQYQHPVAENFLLTGSAGYLNFKSKKDILGNTYNSGVIPVKAGARYYFGENFFVNGELGAGFSTEKGGSTAFIYAPGAGVEFEVSDKSSVELGARYEGHSISGGTVSFIGLRAAFNFGL